MHRILIKSVYTLIATEVLEIYNDAKEVLKDLYLELKKNNVIEEIENIFEVYEYIKNFKNSQVEYFKEFLECIEEE